MLGKTRRIFLFLLAIVPGAVRSEHAVVWSKGTMTDLGTLGGEESWAYAINDSGQVAGTSGTGGGRHAFLWSGGTMVDLRYLGLNYSEGYGIDNAGQVVGFSFIYTLGIDTRGFFWSPSGMEGLATQNTGAMDINNRGQIVGARGYRAFLTNDNGYLAVLWPSKDEDPIVLGTLGGSTNSIANAINDLGQAVGTSANAAGYDRAFLWYGGSMADLGTLGGNNSAAYGINGQGLVVGAAETAAGTAHAFLWSNGAMTDLGTLGGSTSTAFGINDAGVVVGESATADGSVHAFLWRSGSSLCDLGVGSARAINNQEQVAGYSSAAAFSLPADPCAPPAPNPGPTNPPGPTPPPATGPGTPPGPTPPPTTGPGNPPDVPAQIAPSDWRTVKPLSACTSKVCQRGYAKRRTLLKARAMAAIRTERAAKLALDRVDRVKPAQKSKAEIQAARKVAAAKKARERFDQTVAVIQGLHD